MSRFGNFPAIVARLALSGTVAAIGYWYFVSVVSCYAAGLRFCFALALAAPIIIPIAALSGSAAVGFGSAFGHPLLITLLLFGLYEFCAWRQQQSSRIAAVLYEVFDRIHMGAIFLLFHVIIFWVFAFVAALIFYGSTRLTIFLVLSFLASIALAAYALLRSIAVLVRLLLHMPLLIVTTEELRIWNFLGYRRIRWDEFDSADYVSYFNPQGWPFTYIRIRYRSRRPSLFRRATRCLFSRARQDSVMVLPLETIVPDTPDIAEAINRARSRGRPASPQANG